MLRATTAESYDVRINQSGGLRSVRPRIEENSRPLPPRGNLGGIRVNHRPNPGITCNNCGRNHASNQCSTLHGTCHKCLKPGHFARECPIHPSQNYAKPLTLNTNATVRAPLARGPGNHNNLNNNRNRTHEVNAGGSECTPLHL